MSVSRNEGSGSGNIRGIIYSKRKKGGSVKGESAIRGGRSGRTGRPERVISSDNGGGYEENIEHWGPYTGKFRTCEECGQPFMEQLHEYSILATYKCHAGHRIVEIKR